jgi:AraC-like DNA-binding protein
MTSRYRDPLTSLGVPLGGAESPAFQLHEVGCLNLAEEWNFPGVRSPFWRLYWNNRPGAWITSAGRSWAVGPSSFVLVPSHVTFDTHGAPRSVKHFWVHFSLYPDLTTRESLPMHVACRKNQAREMKALTKAVIQAKPSGSPELYHRCSALLHQVFASLTAEAPPPRLPAKLYALLHEIESSLGRPPPVTELARRAGMSRGGFIRWFHQHMQANPARYVLSRRIDHAFRMLKFSSATIEEIAERLGFANRNHFSRAFQRQMGIGPATFRKS